VRHEVLDRAAAIGLGMGQLVAFVAAQMGQYSGSSTSCAPLRGLRHQARGAGEVLVDLGVETIWMAATLNACSCLPLDAVELKDAASMAQKCRAPAPVQAPELRGRSRGPGGVAPAARGGAGAGLVAIAIPALLSISLARWHPPA
jgi:hypothetical protein